MNSRRMLGVCLTIGMLAAFTVMSTSARAGQSKCETLLGTITAQVGALGWAGPAYLSFGKDPMVYTTSLLDVGVASKAHPTFKQDSSGNFAGYELLTFTIDPANWFQISAHFVGIADSTPYAYSFNEEGKITGGGGDFAGVTGTVTIHGSFVIGGGVADPNACAPETPCVWISEMHGTICGRQ